MEAANKGAFEAGGTSIGLNISLPHEAHNNEYQTISLSFEYFFSRKATFFMHSFAYVAMPGGFGTLDELFEALTLIQTGKVPPAPIVLVGSEYWSGLVEWLGAQLLSNGMIGAHDLNLFIIEDDPQRSCARWRNSTPRSATPTRATRPRCQLDAWQAAARGGLAAPYLPLRCPLDAASASCQRRACVIPRAPWRRRHPRRAGQAAPGTPPAATPAGPAHPAARCPAPAPTRSGRPRPTRRQRQLQAGHA